MSLPLQPDHVTSVFPGSACSFLTAKYGFSPCTPLVFTAFPLKLSCFLGLHSEARGGYLDVGKSEWSSIDRLKRLWAVRASCAISHPATQFLGLFLCVRSTAWCDEVLTDQNHGDISYTVKRYRCLKWGSSACKCGFAVPLNLLTLYDLSLNVAWYNPKSTEFPPHSNVIGNAGCILDLVELFCFKNEVAIHLEFAKRNWCFKCNSITFPIFFG